MSPAQIVVNTSSTSASLFTSAEVAALTLLIWDALLCLSDEVAYVWGARQTSWVKWAYLFVRYSPLASMGSTMVLSTSLDSGVYFSSASCGRWLILQGVSTSSLIWVVDFILIMRVYAMYRRSTFVLRLLLFLFILEVVAMIFAAIKTFPNMVVSQGCLVVKSPRVYVTCWLASFAFQTILFAFTLINLIRSTDYRLWGKSLLHTMTRDGLWTFGGIAAVELVNTLMFQLNLQTLSGIAFTWTTVISSLAAAHMQMNLLKQIYNRQETPSSLDGIATSHLVFRSTPETSAERNGSVEACVINA